MLLNVMPVLDTVQDFCTSAASIFRLIGYVILIIKIAIPIIIVVMGMMDLGKAVMAGDDKEVKEAQKMLVKRIVYGVLIFFIVTAVTAVFGLVSDDWNSGVCWSCATKPNSCPVE